MEAPTADDVDRIAANGNAVVRNLQITQCYSELSLAFAERDGAPPAANWCTFATWASKQAGQTIRKEDLTRTFERIFGGSREATEIGNDAVRALAGSGSRRGPDKLWDAVWRALHPEAAFDRASDAVARGNRKVFEEIGREFARFLAVPRTEGRIDAVAYAAFRDSLRPGDPPDGQGYLRRAFDAYAAALEEGDPKVRAELMLFANLAIGWHEQTRLQPEIAESLDAPFAEPVKLKRGLLKELLRLRIGVALRLALALLPGRGGEVRRSIDALDRHVREVAHLAVTELLMTLSFPGGEVLHLGDDVPGVFPDDLRALSRPELTQLLDQVDPTPDTPRGSGARDWSRLAERIHYIADLFRVYQEKSKLLGPPFTPEQVEVLKAGGRPAGRL